MERLAYQIHGIGAGAPVVLLHGFPLDGRMWEPQVSALKGARTVVVPDLYGAGRSPCPSPPPSIEDQADAVADLLYERDLRPVVLCGFSMGGYVALAFASKFPELLAGLVLADTRAAADGDEGRSLRARTAGSVRASGLPPLAESTVPRLLAPGTPESNRPLVSTLREMVLSQSPEGVVAALMAMAARPDRTPDLAQVACPTLLLCGSLDAISPPREMRGMAEAISGSRFAEIPGAAHLSNLENPGAFNAELLAFLAGLT